MSQIEEIMAEQNKVKLSNGKVLEYDYLIIATGSRIAPEEIEGLNNGGWRENIFDFYTPDGASALAKFLKYWDGGKMVLNIAEMPIKCPVISRTNVSLFGGGGRCSTCKNGSTLPPVSS